MFVYLQGINTRNGGHVQYSTEMTKNDEKGKVLPKTTQNKFLKIFFLKAKVANIACVVVREYALI